MPPLNLTSRFLVPVGAVLALALAPLVGLARTPWLAALAGLGALAATGLAAVYFVRRSILGPLGDLTATIARMGQGDLDVQAHVQRADEIGRLAESCNAMVERMRRANQDYMEVLAFVSHELKHPVAAMITDARVLADGYLGPVTPDQARKLERLSRSGYQLLELVAEYLDLAKIEAGTLELQPRRVPFLSEVAEPAAALVQSQAQARGMSLDLCLPADLDPVECDPHLLKIVLVNLLGNGIKYGREGGAVRLTVEAPPGRLKVAVWNQGPGFPSLGAQPAVPQVQPPPGPRPAGAPGHRHRPLHRLAHHPPARGQHGCHQRAGPVGRVQLPVPPAPALGRGRRQPRGGRLPPGGPAGGGRLTWPGGPGPGPAPLVLGRASPASWEPGPKAAGVGTPGLRSAADRLGVTAFLEGL